QVFGLRIQRGHFFAVRCQSEPALGSLWQDVFPQEYMGGL
ncbi:MAG: hypothetical protein ACJAZO_004535, partial [Myxococcota bacterium]